MISLVVLALIVVLYWFFMSPYSQTFGTFRWHGPRTRKVVALTFDDGPNEPYTSQIAEYLHSEGVPATFFVVGANIDRFPEVPKKLVKLGHTIGNHSYNHQFRHYFTSSNFAPELSRNEQTIERATGKRSALFRPPWLFRTPLVLSYADSKGYTAVSGDFCHVFEIFQPSAARIAARTLAKVKPGTIIIFHDGFNARTADRTQTVAAVKLVVERLKQQGYEFVAADTLLGVPAYQTSSEK